MNTWKSKMIVVKFRENYQNEKDQWKESKTLLDLKETWLILIGIMLSQHHEVLGSKEIYLSSISEWEQAKQKWKAYIKYWESYYIRRKIAW